MQKLAVSDTILPRRHAAAQFLKSCTAISHVSLPLDSICMHGESCGDTLIFASPQLPAVALSDDGTWGERQPRRRSPGVPDRPPRFGDGGSPGGQQVEERCAYPRSHTPTPSPLYVSPPVGEVRGMRI